MSEANREHLLVRPAGILILLAAGLLLCQPWTAGIREFFLQEGFFGAQAMEMDPDLPMSVAHGEALQNTFPLYPLVVSWCIKGTGLALEPALRLITFAATALMAVLVYWAARSTCSEKAAQVATAMFLSLPAVIGVSITGNPDPLIAFGILAAHLIWFYFGVRRANWNLAWLLALAVMAPTFYAGGFKALFFFLFPLIFMRRPLTVWQKLSYPGLAAGTAIVLAAVALWAIPYWSFSRLMPVQTVWNGEEILSWHWLLTYPFQFLLLTLPWAFLAWAPFCVALQPLSETPIFSRFLRTIFFSTFFAVWLLPGCDRSDLLYLAAPLAILTGLHYEPAVRRHPVFMQGVKRLCCLILFGAAGALIAFPLLPQALLETVFSFSHSIDFRSSQDFMIRAFVVAGLLLAAGFLVFCSGKKTPVWVILLTASVGCGFFYWTAVHRYNAQEQNKRAIGKILRNALERDRAGKMPLPLYKIDIQNLYAECCYLNNPVIKIRRLNELPPAAGTVYLLGTEFPQLPERNWTNLLAPEEQTYYGQRIGLWRGDLRRDPDAPLPERD